MSNTRDQHQAAEALARAAEEAALQIRAELYAEVFQTPQGAKVLEDLANQIGLLRSVRTTDAATLHHLEGQRSVATFILAMLKRASKDDKPTITLPL